MQIMRAIGINIIPVIWRWSLWIKLIQCYTFNGETMPKSTSCKTLYRNALFFLQFTYICYIIFGMSYTYVGLQVSSMIIHFLNKNKTVWLVYFHSTGYTVYKRVQR